MRDTRSPCRIKISAMGSFPVNPYSQIAEELAAPGVSAMSNFLRGLCALLGLVALGELSSPCLSQTQDQPKKPEKKPETLSQSRLGPQGGSVTDRLDLTEMQSFRPGRSKAEILKEIHWVGNFEMATEDHGKTLAAMSFNVCVEDQVFGDFLWAIFVDDKFVKFVDSPAKSTPVGEGKDLKFIDSPVKIKFPIPVGSFEPLLRIAGQNPISVKKFKQELEAYAEEDRKRHPDPFLTALAEKIGPQLVATNKPLEEKNTRLRDQFNAAKLKLGMTKAEVAAMLKSEPLDTGKLEAGSFEVYGSTDFAPFIEALHYHNIFALYHGDRLIGIYSGDVAPGGKDGFESLRKAVPKAGFPDPQHFTGLPPAVVKAQ
jgi:hypothetical protein